MTTMRRCITLIAMLGLLAAAGCSGDDGQPPDAGTADLYSPDLGGSASDGAPMPDGTSDAATPDLLLPPDVGVPPTSGSWSGKGIQFNISSDGSTITKSGTALNNSSSLILGPISWSKVGTCSKASTTWYSHATIKLTKKPGGSSFYYSSSDWSIKGTIVAGSASGTYTYNKKLLNCGVTVKGSGAWTATPGSP